MARNDSIRQGPAKRASSPSRKTKNQRGTRGTRKKTVDTDADMEPVVYSAWHPLHYIRSYFGDHKAVDPYIRRTVICQIIAMSVGLTVTLPTLILLFDREPVVNFYGLVIEPSTVIPGQTVYINWRGHEYRLCDGSVTRRVVDSTGRVFTYATEPISAQDRATINVDQRYRREFTIPFSISGGEAKYTSRVLRWCNWAQKFIWPIVEERSATMDVVGRREGY